MVKKTLQTEMFLELVFSVSGETNEHLILKKSIPFYLRKLNCFFAGVLKNTEDGQEEVMLTPFVASKSKDWAQVKAYFADRKQKEKETYSQLFLKGFYYYAFRLNSYGILILGRKKTFDDTFTNELKPIINHLGKVLNQANEIEQRKKAEEALKESEQRFRTLSDTTTSGILIYHDKKIVYANLAAERISGYSKIEFKALNFLDIVHPDFKELVREQALAKQRSEKRPTHYEIKIIRKDKEERWIDITNGLIEWRGEPAIIISAFDITKHKQAERRIDHLNLVLRAIRNVNQLITKEKDRDRLLKGACENLIETRGYYYAWIALLEESGKFITAAADSLGQDFSSLVKMLKSGKMTECAKIVQKKSDIVIIKDPANECKDCPLSKKYKGKGRMTVRLKYLEKIYGLMTVSIPIELINDIEEHNLLKEVAGDIAFALYNIEVEKERKQAEERNRFLSSVVEQSADGMAIANMEGNLLFINNKWVSMHGYEKAEELLGQNLRIFHNKEQLKDDVEPFNRQVKKKGYYTGEVGHTRRDGTIFCTQMTTTLLMDENNNPIAIAGVATDITGRKQAEEALHQAHTQLTATLNALPDLLFEVDLDGHIYDFRAPHPELLFVPPEEFLGKTIHEVLPTDAAQVIGQAIAEAAVTGRHIGATYALPLPNGAGWFELSIAAKGDPNTPTSRFIGLVRDITDRKQAEKKLLAAKEKAEESDRLKSAFLTNMSHEIRTPMNAILGFTNLLKEPKLTGEEQHEYIKIIENSGTRMLNTINDLIDISKIESGQMEVSISETNINEQIEYIYIFFKPEVERKKMQLFFKNSLPAKEAIIKTDREKVYAILTNLVKNAIKYTIEGSIEFGYEKKGNYLEFFVKDTGIGIAHNKQQVIFERFVQADISNKRAFQGAGLGLSITKSYVEMLGGKIWVESKPGKGSIFYFTIPYNAEMEEKHVIKNVVSGKDKEGQIKNLKILIAEDDEPSEMFLTIALKKISKEVLYVRTGVEAVEVCLNNPDIDLVLMDIKMPEIDGYEATRQIREFNKNVVIIAQTAYGLYGDREKAIEVGCNDFISKPINKDELMGLIQKYFKQ